MYVHLVSLLYSRQKFSKNIKHFISELEGGMGYEREHFLFSFQMLLYCLNVFRVFFII